MPGSRASVFGEAEDFQAGLSGDGVTGLLVTGRGQFRARMTEIGLEHLRLSRRRNRGSRLLESRQTQCLSHFRPSEGRHPSGAGSRSEPENS